MSIVSRPGNDKYRENYDRIFGERVETAMKCINGPWCSRIGLSGGKECCGYLLAVGETKFINSSGIINEPCPFVAI